jgi:asparagine synthase (glutamine-hydrolysing)
MQGASWWLGWGQAVPTAGATWSDQGHLSVFGATGYWAISPSQRFAIVGDSEGDLLDMACGWEQQGCEYLQGVSFFFAIAVWDFQDKCLWLGRDGVGGKTLYYTWQGSTLWVAPRLRSLKPYHPRKLHWVALREYLCCAFVPGTQTLWQGVHQLAPGTLWRLPHKETLIFWQPTVHQPTLPPADLDTYAQALRRLLLQVVTEKLAGASQVGIFLSGGIDSSAVAALSAQVHSSKPIAYSIHFGKNLPNELAFSGLVAQHCGLEHILLEISFEDMWRFLPETMFHLDQPIGDPLTVPNWLLAKRAQSQVALVLNGEGGDPCFGGPKNQPMLLSQTYGYDLITSYGRSFQKCFDDLPQLLHPEIWTAVKDAPFFFAPDLADSSVELLQRLFLINIKFKGANHILTKVNNLLGSAGLQGRSPLFDPRVVDFSLRIPTACKVQGAEEKVVLKRAVADLLPPAILHRPKSGMMVPVHRGFQEHWQRAARHLLCAKNAQIAPYVQSATVQNWLSYRNDPWHRYGVKLWLLTSLEIWLQQN